MRIGRRASLALAQRNRTPLPAADAHRAVALPRLRIAFLGAGATVRPVRALIVGPPGSRAARRAYPTSLLALVLNRVQTSGKLTLAVQLYRREGLGWRSQSITVFTLGAAGPPACRVSALSTSLAAAAERVRGYELLAWTSSPGSILIQMQYRRSRTIFPKPSHFAPISRNFGRAHCVRSLAIGLHCFSVRVRRVSLSRNNGAAAPPRTDAFLFCSNS